MNWRIKHISHGMFIVASILMFGFFLRAWQYALNRSLWLDEAMLALNIIHKSFAGLTQPLDYKQGAPLLFLFIQKAVVVVLGNSEFALRLFPFMAGILSLFLMCKTSRKYLHGIAVYVALALFCLSPALVYYSSENKQYSCDVMSTLVLLLSAFPCLKTTGKLQDYMLLTGAGLLLMWMSHPAIFVLCGIGIACFLSAAVKKDAKGLLWTVSAILLWSISFFFLYNVSLRCITMIRGIQLIWNACFMPMPPWNNWNWFSSISFGVSSFFFVSSVLLLTGVISILLRDWRSGLVFISPVIAALLASGFRKYPFTLRLSLFLAPVIFILIAEGFGRIHGTMVKYGRLASPFVAVVLLLFLLGKPALITVRGLKNPDMREHIRPIMEYVRRNKRDSDLIYVAYSSKAAFEYYAPFFGFKKTNYRPGVSPGPVFAEYWKDIGTLKGKNRVWFIFSHSPGKDTPHRELYYDVSLNTLGRKIDEFLVPGAAAFLYDLTV